MDVEITLVVKGFSKTDEVSEQEHADCVADKVEEVLREGMHPLYPKHIQAVATSVRG